MWGWIGVKYSVRNYKITDNTLKEYTCLENSNYLRVVISPEYKEYAMAKSYQGEPFPTK